MTQLNQGLAATLSAADRISRYTMGASKIQDLLNVLIADLEDMEDKNIILQYLADELYILGGPQVRAEVKYSESGKRWYVALTVEIEAEIAD